MWYTVDMTTLAKQGTGTDPIEAEYRSPPARQGRPSNLEVSVREFRKQEKYLRQQVSLALPILGDHYPELIRKAVQIALSDTDKVEQARMLRFLVELPFKYVPMEEEAESLAGRLREKWTREIYAPKAEVIDGSTEEEGNTGDIGDAEYRVVS